MLVVPPLVYCYCNSQQSTVKNAKKVKQKRENPSSALISRSSSRHGSDAELDPDWADVCWEPNEVGLPSPSPRGIGR